MTPNKKGGDPLSNGNLTLDKAKVDALKGSVIVVKYGGNAMNSEAAGKQVFLQIATLKELGVRPVIVHGGGPAIKKMLDKAGLQSTFVEGHRVTDREAMAYVEMALRGQVNGEIVRELNTLGLKAVGLSGKDASMVEVTKRKFSLVRDGKREEVDLGYVGDVVSVNTGLILTLLDNDYIPVLAPVATGSDRMDYNVNADMFAGSVAGALKAAAFVALTNVDGLLEDPENPETLISRLTVNEAKALIGGAIQGGMIPKIDACLAALKQGVEKAHIVNGMKPETLLEKLLTGNRCGTTIEKD